MLLVGQEKSELKVNRVLDIHFFPSCKNVCCAEHCLKVCSDGKFSTSVGQWVYYWCKVCHKVKK